eukprot:TRINITY_DN10663_c0_g1_i1.p1 TRINITY_DN10663_c0_g1~~TRINITY_DN10663_c0_g1_i1.p1  ORF type:complete len:198 (-),score=59.59 TRINITY_DN10663_c0_g1_i1:26-574(-)
MEGNKRQQDEDEYTPVWSMDEAHDKMGGWRTLNGYWKESRVPDIMDNDFEEDDWRNWERAKLQRLKEFHIMYAEHQIIRDQYQKCIFYEAVNSRKQCRELTEQILRRRSSWRHGIVPPLGERTHSLVALRSVYVDGKPLYRPDRPGPNSKFSRGSSSDDETEESTEQPEESSHEEESPESDE